MTKITKCIECYDLNIFLIILILFSAYIFIQALKVKRTEHDEKFHGIFIRAPGIVSIDNKEDVKVLATLPRGKNGNFNPSSINIGTS